MLFHVANTVRVPHGEDSEKIRRLGALEHERAVELQLQGKWPHLWRVTGKWANISVFKVDEPAELHAILESLPLYPYLETDVVSLCRHPGSLSQED